MCSRENRTMVPKVLYQVLYLGTMVPQHMQTHQGTVKE